MYANLILENKTGEVIGYNAPNRNLEQRDVDRGCAMDNTLRFVMIDFVAFWDGLKKFKLGMVVSVMYIWLLIV